MWVYLGTDQRRGSVKEKASQSLREPNLEHCVSCRINTTYLVMRQSNPAYEILRHSKNVSQHVDFEFIKGLVDGRFEQRLQLMQTIFNLQSRLRVHHVAVFVCVGDGRAVTGVRKPQSFWRRREQSRFET